MSLARNLSKFKPSSSGLIETADIADDAVSTDQIANDATINTSGAITGGTLTGTIQTASQPNITSVGTLTGFTSSGIDDNADANVVTITDAEAVGIGKSLTPNNYSGYQVVTIGGSDASTGSVIDMENSNGLINGQLNASSGRLHIGVDPLNANGGSSIRFEVDGGSKFEMDSEHLTINDGNLVIGTGGHGIDFSAQTHATSTGGHGNPTVQSEILDHYEEGEFNYGMNVNMTQVTNANFGRYTRIGNLVTVNARMDIATISGSNVIFFANLPFACSAFTGGGKVDNVYIGSLQLYIIGDGGYSVTGKNVLIENASGTAYCFYSVASGTHTYITNAMAGTSSELYMTLTYRTG